MEHFIKIMSEITALQEEAEKRRKDINNELNSLALKNPPDYGECIEKFRHCEFFNGFCSALQTAYVIVYRHLIESEGENNDINNHDTLQ